MTEIEIGIEIMGVEGLLRRVGRIDASLWFLMIVEVGAGRVVGMGVLGIRLMIR